MLPVSKRSQDLVRDILPVTKVGDAVIRAKSGLLGAERGKPSLGWMVGWAEKGERTPCSRSTWTAGSRARSPRA